MYYFSYGSNMDRRQMSHRCPGARSVGQAFLDGWRLAFRSRVIGPARSAVASVEQDVGSMVPGRLWQVTAEHLVELDRCEGVPLVYQRRAVMVRVAGREAEVPAQVYVRGSADHEGVPAPGYLDRIVRGYRECGHDREALLRALGTEAVFVYGTLKRGHGNHWMMEGSVFLGVARTVPGWRLYDLGVFPAMVQGAGHVWGELWQVDRAALARLDRLEGVPHFYQRDQVMLEDGRSAWAYVQKPERVAGRPLVAGGCWRPEWSRCESET